MFAHGTGAVTEKLDGTSHITSALSDRSYYTHVAPTPQAPWLVPSPSRFPLPARGHALSAEAFVDLTANAWRYPSHSLIFILSNHRHISLTTLT
jgi:hypothetical protein